MKIPGLGDRPSTKVNCMEPRLCPNAPMGACLLLAYRYFSTRTRKNKNHVERITPRISYDNLGFIAHLGDGRDVRGVTDCHLKQGQTLFFQFACSRKHARCCKLYTIAQNLTPDFHDRRRTAHFTFYGYDTVCLSHT